MGREALCQGWCWLPAAGGQAAPWLGRGSGADNGTRESRRRRLHAVVRGGRTVMRVLLIAEADLTEMVA